jgi:cardiolipin synthase|nr:phosphatidylserine/phosphatidylglycerophosphate/cardiolipin synthase family protein [Kofleriaceae bacterium]
MANQLAAPLPKQLAIYARSTARWRAGCEVTVLRDGGATYAAMLAAIRGAAKTICLETYILVDDTTGDRFKSALLERAKAGVRVRVLYDAVGSLTLSTGWLGELREAGVDIVEFNPIAPWRARFQLSHRDHRKVLVVDDAVAFTGGLNISNDYAAVADGGAGWHDMHCCLRGPIVADLARGFRRTWLRAGGASYPLPRGGTDVLGEGFAGDAPAGAFVRLLENTGRRQRTAIRRAYLHVIKHARQHVLIQNAYFLPDRGLRRALARAARRGVDVRVLTPGRSDVKLVEWAGLYVMQRLAKRGVKFLLWNGPMMHAKTAVVDGTWSTIGSYNFDAQSRFNNLELTVEILDSAIGAALVREHDEDLANSTAYDPAAWSRLAWWRRAAAWIAFRLRRLL